MQPTELTSTQRQLADARGYSKADVIARYRRGDIDWLEAHGAMIEIDTLSATELFRHAAAVRAADKATAVGAR